MPILAFYIICITRLRRTTQLPTYGVQWYKEPWFLNPFKRLSCLVEGANYHFLFSLPTPGIEPALHVWLESRPCCHPVATYLGLQLNLHSEITAQSGEM